MSLRELKCEITSDWSHEHTRPHKLPFFVCAEHKSANRDETRPNMAKIKCFLANEGELSSISELWCVALAAQRGPNKFLTCKFQSKRRTSKLIIWNPYAGLVGRLYSPPSRRKRKLLRRAVSERSAPTYRLNNDCSILMNIPSGHIYVLCILWIYGYGILYDELKLRSMHESVPIRISCRPF